VITRSAELNPKDIEEIKEILKRVEQKLDMVITRLLPHGRLVDEGKLERPIATKDWLKNMWSERAWKRAYAL